MRMVLQVHGLWAQSDAGGDDAVGRGGDGGDTPYFDTHARRVVGVDGRRSTWRCYNALLRATAWGFGGPEA